MSVKVHVNSHVIRANKMKGENNPPLRIIRKGRSEPAYEVELIGPARVIYSPDKPLKCGARVWVSAEDARPIPSESA
jgi:hypothetical protein